MPYYVQIFKRIPLINETFPRPIYALSDPIAAKEARKNKGFPTPEGFTDGRFYKMHMSEKKYGNYVRKHCSGVLTQNEIHYYLEEGDLESFYAKNLTYHPNFTFFSGHSALAASTFTSEPKENLPLSCKA